MARVVSELVHVIVRPVRARPSRSYGIAESCRVSPGERPTVDGVTVTVATGACVMVTAACPWTVPAAPTIVACPTAMPLTVPVGLTEATAVLELVHAMVPVAMVEPRWSSPEALAIEVWPTGMLVGESDTDRVMSTAGAGVVGALAESPPPPPLHAALTAVNTKPADAGHVSSRRQIGRAHV